MAERLKLNFNDICYVGDNIKKDFVTSENLGMRSIWFSNADGLY